jgi:hypothetical protein
VTDIGVVFVTVYAGNAVESGSQKFFALGDPPAGKVDRAAVGDAIRATRKEAGRVKVVYTLDASASESTPPFLVLKDEAKTHGLTPITRKEYDDEKR